MGQLVAPHTLLRLTSSAVFHGDAPVPDWVNERLAACPVVVVRRGPQTDDRLPVGVRGPERQQRWAGAVALTDVTTVITPMDLVVTRAWQNVSSIRQVLPAIQALPKLAPILNAISWGIGGSVGFELATGQPTAKPTSDLDLIVPKLAPISVTAAQELLAKLNQFGVHVDLQVVAGQNGFSLEEYAQQRSATVMLKTMTGPKLVADPWQAVNNGVSR